MALRVLSEINVVGDYANQEIGSATIDFNPHAIRGDGRGADMREVGPDRPFSSEACKVVLERKLFFKQWDKDTAFGGTAFNRGSWDLHDHFYRGRGEQEVV